MGRLVYVREVSACLYLSRLRTVPATYMFPLTYLFHKQDREAEPRFTGPSSRGDHGGAPRGGFGGGYGPGGAGGGAAGGGGRQIYVSNVCCLLYHSFRCCTQY